MNQLLLFQQFPRLRDTMPFVPLGTYPTPVERLTAVEQATRLPANGQLWVKRDDLSGEPWGMSKVRKLEHYFGDAQAVGARRVLTFGPLGSNHALATALYGKQLGFEVHLQLWPEPAMERVRQTLLAEQALGAKLFLVGTLNERALGDLVDSGVRGNVYIIPPAGTDPVGAMGYVEAGLEIGAQVAGGELPEPDFVHVAGGTGGVAAGLVIGLRLAKLRSRVVAIRCVAAEVLTELRVVFLARRLRQRLARLVGVEESSLPQPATEDFLILHDQAGGGYGQPTEAAERARALFETNTSVMLDGTYTAKAAAGMLTFASSAEGAGGRHLFFHTYAHRALGGLTAGASWRDLPSPFHICFGGLA